jgi:hypothetical protein
MKPKQSRRRTAPLRRSCAVLDCGFQNVDWPSDRWKAHAKYWFRSGGSAAADLEGLFDGVK